MMWILLVILACVLMSGLFSGAEIGFYSVNRLRLRSRVEAGQRGAAVLQALLDRPGATIMTTLIGTNIMNYLASAMATNMLRGHRHSGLLATLILTPIILIVGEMIPKDIFHRKADSLMYVLARPIQALRWLLSPLTWAFQGIVSLVTAGKVSSHGGSIFSRAALGEWIAEGRREGVLTDYQQALSVNVMGLLRKSVSSVMIPVEAATTVRGDLSGAALRSVIRQAGYSRLPVVSGPENDIVGILHALDYVFSTSEKASAVELARKAVRVRHTDQIAAALVALQRERQQMAVVAGDDGRPVGIVTVKDLVEEIVGELRGL